MIYVASVMYYSSSQGAELRVFTGGSIEEINEEFNIFQERAEGQDIEYIESAILTLIDENGCLQFCREVETKQRYTLTEFEA